MPRIVCDVADGYVFRLMNARPQFLVLRRGNDAPLPGVWQAIHAKVEAGETAVEAIVRDLEQATALTPLAVYSADYVGQFYDHRTDSVVLSPSFAVEVSPTASLTVAPPYDDHAWCDLEETTGRLIWSSQRWAVRHIYDVIAMGGNEADFYALS